MLSGKDTYRKNRIGMLFRAIKIWLLTIQRSRDSKFEICFFLFLYERTKIEKLSELIFKVLQCFFINSVLLQFVKFTVYYEQLYI